ncbi:MAG: hypothetical protein OXN15_02035 [Chloroflexota bacterium]|nr:hypothetical protein [Chloroflexota bacterium]MDE2969729.1 hypothetical protein [Chloroflexota bacterium]
MVDEMGRDDMERKLDGYFAEERAELRAPGDLWANVSARLGEQDPAPWWRRVFGGMAVQGMGRVYAGAAAALAVAVVGAVMYTAILGTGGEQSGSFSEESATTTSATMSMAAAAPAMAPEPAAPVAAAAVAEAQADAAMPKAAMADAVPREPAGLTQNASAATMAEEPPFRNEVWGLLNGARTHLFWVALPRDWESGAPAYAGGVWSGVISGPGVTLEYSFGEREMTDSLRTATLAEATARQQRAWDEYVIGNLAFMVAPPEGTVGDLRMTLQLPTGTLRFSGEALGPFQQELAFMVFRSIIA